jgi:uncharacterized protein YybS (DUF2232 family)
MGLTSAVLAGGISAALFSYAFSHAETLQIFFAYLAGVPLFAVGLGAGSVSGFVAALIAVVGLILVVSPNLAVIYAALYALPIAVLTVLAMRYKQGDDQKVYWYPEGYLLTALTLYPCLLFLAAVGVMAGQDGGLLGLSSQALHSITDQVSGQMDPEMAARLPGIMEQIARVLPAMAGCSWIFLILVSAWAAQAILKRSGWLLRSPFGWRDLTLPNWVTLAVAITGLAGYFAPEPYNYIGANICIMFCVPLFLAGLAVVHVYAETRKMSRKAAITLLILFYVLLSFLPWLSPVVAMLGALDQGMNLRRRMTAPPASN